MPGLRCLQCPQHPHFQVPIEYSSLSSEHSMAFPAQYSKNIPLLTALLTMPSYTTQDHKSKDSAAYTVPSLSIMSREIAHTGLPRGQFCVHISSVKVPSSQRTRVCVELTKLNRTLLVFFRDCDKKLPDQKKFIGGKGLFEVACHSPLLREVRGRNLKQNPKRKDA